MSAPNNKKYFYLSAALHAAVLLILISSFDLSSPLPVIENSNQRDVISAVVLGDTSKSKLLLKKEDSSSNEQPSIETPPKLIPVQQSRQQAKALEKAAREAIALRITEKKKLLEDKKQEEKKRAEEKRQAEKKKKLARLKNEAKKRRAALENAFLEDLKKIKNENKKQKRVANKKLKSTFEKTLKEQTEASLRQQLLAEEIRLQGIQSRQSQGEVNKYKALILQAISENWIVPVHADKKRYCELMIRLAPGGMVMDVQIIKSSGDVSLDSSARAAVLKSSPLPVPSETNEFDAFRQFVLKVKPENISPT